MILIYISSATHKQVPHMHAAMENKPLVKYNPTSYRNRLPVPSIVMPHKNSSQIVIGDRVNAHKTQYVTTNKSHYPSHPLDDATSHPAILAARTLKVNQNQLK